MNWYICQDIFRYFRLVDEDQYYYLLLLKSLVEEPLFQNSIRERLIWELGKLKKLEDLQKNYHIHFDCHQYLDINAFDNFFNAICVKDSLADKSIYREGKVSPQVFDRGVIACLIWEFLGSASIIEFEGIELNEDEDGTESFVYTQKYRDELKFALKQLESFVNHQVWWKICQSFIFLDEE